MKKHLITFLLLIPLAPSLASASTATNACGGMDAIMARNDVDCAARFMSSFHFSGDALAVQGEAKNISRMAAKFIPQDGSGDIDEFYYSIFQQNPEAMNSARESLSAKDKLILKKSYDETDYVRKHGNGQRDIKKDDKVAGNCPKDSSTASSAHKPSVDIPVFGAIAKALTNIPSALAGGLTPPAPKSTRGPASVPQDYSSEYDDSPGTAE
jgi:hypothetical protein